MLGCFMDSAWLVMGAERNRGRVYPQEESGLGLGGATTMATWVTSNTTMLAPVFAYKFGLWGMLAYSTASFGLFLFALFLPRIRELLPQGVTAGDFFYLRYGKIGWVIFLIITITYSTSWLVSMAIAGGDLLECAGIPYVRV